MTYFRTKYGQIIDENNQVIPMIEGNALYIDYVEYLKNEGTILETDFVFPEDLAREEREQTMIRYEKYKLDGWQAYQEFRAELVRKIKANILTEAQAFIIEEYLSKGYDKIAQNGDWKTARYKLSTTTIPSQYSFVNEYLSSALAIITAYIEKNYPVI